MSRSVLGQHQAAATLHLEVLAGVALDLLPQRHEAGPSGSVSAARLPPAVRPGRNRRRGAGRAGCRHWRRRPAGSPRRARPPAPRCPRAPASRRGRSPRRRRRSPACRRSRPAVAAVVARPRHVGRHEIGLWPLHSGCSTRQRADRHRLGRRRAARTGRPRRPRAVSRARRTRRAVAALAAAHAGARRPLQRGRASRGRPRSARAASPAVTSSQRQTMVAVGDRRRCRTGGARTGATAPPGSARRGRASRRAAGSSGTVQAEIARATASPASAPARQRRRGRRRSRAPSPTAKTLGQAGAALRVGHASPVEPLPRVDEAMRAAQRAGQLRSRGGSRAQRHDIGVDRAARPRASTPARRRAPRPRRRVTLAPQCTARRRAQPREVARGRRQQVGRGARRRPAARASCARPGRGAASSTADDVGAAVEQLAGESAG